MPDFQKMCLPILHEYHDLLKNSQTDIKQFETQLSFNIFLPKLLGKQMMNSYVSTNIYKHLCYFYRSYVTEKRYTDILCFVHDTF